MYAKFETAVFVWTVPYIRVIIELRWNDWLSKHRRIKTLNELELSSRSFVLNYSENRVELEDEIDVARSCLERANTASIGWFSFNHSAKVGRGRRASPRSRLADRSRRDLNRRTG